jgi:hypothetical protein
MFVTFKFFNYNIGRKRFYYDEYWQKKYHLKIKLLRWDNYTINILILIFLLIFYNSMHTIFQKFQLGIYIHFSSIALLIGDVYLSKHLNWTSKNFHKKTIDTWSVLKVGSAKLNTYNYLIIIFSLKRYIWLY